MTRIRNLFALLLWVVIAPFSSLCQDVNLHLGGGLAIPSSPEGFSRLFKTGVSIVGGLGFPISSSVVLVGSVEYSRFPFDDVGFFNWPHLPTTQNYGISGGERSIVTATVNSRILLSPARNSVCPYFVVGIGFAHSSQAEATIAGSPIFRAAAESALMVHGGGGIDIPVSNNVYLFGEGRYGLALIEMNTKTFWPITAGIRVRV